MNKKFSKALVVLSLVFVSVLALNTAAFAAISANPSTELDKTKTAIVSGGGAMSTSDLPTMVGNIINAFLGLLGVVALIIIVIGGLKWMTAGGNEDKVTEAKNFLMAGIIGMIIIIAAYAIAGYLVDVLVAA